jgi:hypothetical protein
MRIIHHHSSSDAHGIPAKTDQVIYNQSQSERTTSHTRLSCLCVVEQLIRTSLIVLSQTVLPLYLDCE